MIADPSLFRAVPRPEPANSNAAPVSGEALGAE
jgi:hypothetical protein